MCARSGSSRLEAFLVYDPHHPLSPGALGLAVDRPLVPESVGARGKLPDRAHERDPGSRFWLKAGKSMQKVSHTLVFRVF